MPDLWRKPLADLRDQFAAIDSELIHEPGDPVRF
jgi:hypothetical protein